METDGPDRPEANAKPPASPDVARALEGLERLRGEIQNALERRDGESLTRLLRARAALLRQVRESSWGPEERQALLEQARQETAAWLNRAHAIRTDLEAALDHTRREREGRVAVHRAYQPPTASGGVLSTRA